MAVGGPSREAFSWKRCAARPAWCLGRQGRPLRTGCAQDALSPAIALGTILSFPSRCNMNDKSKASVVNGAAGPETPSLRPLTAVF